MGEDVGADGESVSRRNEEGINVKLNRVWAVMAAVAVVGSSATAAFAMGDHKNHDQKSSTTMEDTTTSMEEDPEMIGEERMDEVAGVRMVPSIMAREVFLTPSSWFLRGKGNTANATAKVYTNMEGAITGLTLTAWGLPNAESINPRYSDYVVWLVDTDTNQMKNIGVLESRNAGKAVFGYTPEVPVSGFDRIVVTPEPTGAIGWPSGWQQLDAELPKVTMAPMTQPVQPMMEPTRPMMPQ